MTAVKAADVDRALKARSPEIGVLLFYGPDAGLVAERSRRAASSAVPDPSDTMQLIRLDGEQVADQPGRLVEEATTFGLFGGSRAIWVRPTSRDIASAVSACLDVALTDTVLVIEAGDLKPTSALRKACETSPRALALPCYPDEQRDLGTVITEALKAEGLSIDRDARELLIDSLGGDRLASRGELAKLALFVGAGRTVTVADVEAVVSDVSGLGLDATLDAAFGGDLKALDEGLSQLDQHGVPSAATLSMATRHALILLSLRTELDGGGQLDAALRGSRGVPYRRHPALKAQLDRWPRRRLLAALSALQRATLGTRQQAGLASAVTRAALTDVAGLARASRR